MCGYLETKGRIVALMRDAAGDDPEMVGIKCKRIKNSDMWVAGWQWTSPHRHGVLRFLVDPYTKVYNVEQIRRIYARLKERSSMI